MHRNMHNKIHSVISPLFRIKNADTETGWNVQILRSVWIISAEIRYLLSEQKKFQNKSKNIDEVYQSVFFRCIMFLSYRVTFLCNVLGQIHYTSESPVRYFFYEKVVKWCIYIIINGIICMETAVYMRSIFKVNSGIYIVLSGFEVLGGIIMMFISPDTVKVAAILTGIIFILNAVIDSVILYRIHKIGRHCTEHIQDVVDELNGNIIDEDDVK